MTLEEELQLVLGLSMVPDASADFAMWHDADTAEDSFFWTRDDCEHRTRFKIALKFCARRFNEGLTSPSPYVRRLTQLSGLRADALARTRSAFLDRASDEMIAGMTEAKWTPESKAATKAYFYKELEKALQKNGL